MAALRNVSSAGDICSDVTLQRDQQGASQR
jgi:hypothetical protein